jgi:high-affinity nickel-transport protein
MNLAHANDWPTLCALVLLLGMKHGFDADHLATIDGLTRWNARRGSPLARWCGTLFSLGHGVVVVAIALGVSLAATTWQVPGWVDGFGTAVSIVFLLLLGVANLQAVLGAEPGAVVRPVGIKGRVFGSLTRGTQAWQVAAVGALFALSFDTLSQAALFAVLSSRYGGWAHALTLGGLFLLGMLIVDGINGLWISRLLRRTDELARQASRVMSLAVAGVSLLVAGWACAQLLLPSLEAWGEGKELAFGAVVMTVIAAAFVTALALAQRDQHLRAQRVTGTR